MNKDHHHSDTEQIDIYDVACKTGLKSLSFLKFHKFYISTQKTDLIYLCLFFFDDFLTWQSQTERSSLFEWLWLSNDANGETHHL